MPDAISLVFGLAILVMSVVIHEVSHGIAAYLLGDKTAYYEGRLTLNPIPHIDPFGSILLPLLLSLTGSPFLIGWAKPVPFNPYNLIKAPKWGPGIVAAAGPISNLVIATFFGILIRLGGHNIIPFPQQFLEISALIALLNIALAVFNLVPIPPLDGSKVLIAALPDRLHNIAIALEAWGFVLLIAFILLFSPVVSVITSILFRIIVG
ncbi:MAG: site-2 protease family protein [Patescibacteria group bacterium]